MNSAESTAVSLGVGALRFLHAREASNSLQESPRPHPNQMKWLVIISRN